MTTDTDVTNALLQRASELRDSPWKEEVRRRTELCVMDSLACFSVGRQLQHHAPTVAAARALFGADSSPFVTAYLYGQAANSLDFDDTLVGHPGASIVGCVLALARREDLPLERILRGVAAGYDAHLLLGSASAPSPGRAQQVRSVAVWDTVAAALAGAVALGLSDLSLERVLGLATSHSLLPYTAKWYERPVPSLKNNLGWAAAGGVLSVQLAVEGQIGVTRPLEGAAGMWRMTGSDRWEPDLKVLEKAGVLRAGFKEYPACWHIQEYLKATASIIRILAPDERVASVRVIGPMDVERFASRDVHSTADIAFSLPATISLLAKGVEPGPAWDRFRPGAPELSLIDRVHFERSTWRSVSVRTTAGRTIERVVARGEGIDLAEHGLSDQAVLAKHHRWADPAIRGTGGVAAPEAIFALLAPSTASIAAA
jgi:2-methylcitrate dehydratase PrpD